MDRRSKYCKRCGADNWQEKADGRRRCRPCHARRQAGSRSRLPHYGLFQHARSRAREKGLPFTLTPAAVEDALRTCGWVCAYCDAPVGSFPGPVRPRSATLDRLVPAVGYTPANIVIACHQCNSAKGEHTSGVLRLWADKIDIISQLRGVA